VAVIRRRARLAHYYPSATAPALCAAIGRYLGVAPGQVVVGGGSSTLMHAVVAAFTAPGGEVVTLAPSFGVYAELAAIHGRAAVSVALDPPDFALDPRRLEAVLSPRTHLVFLARPNNPTSTLVPLPVLDAIAARAAAVGALVVSDEAYLEFADAPRRETAVGLIRSPAPRRPNVLVTRTFSKAFGLADLRLGYAVGTPESAQALALANAKWPTGALAQAAGIAALEDRRHLARTIAVVRQGRRRLARELARLGLGVAPRPQGNYLLVDVGARGFKAREFAEALLAVARVAVRGDFADRFVRVSVGRPADNRRLVAGVRRLLAARR
jgi:histidinol-phosphate aminotransferase